MFSCSPYDLGQTLLHLFAAGACVIFQVGTGQRRDDGRLRDIARRRAQLLDEGERGDGQVSVVAGHVQRLLEVLERLIQQNHAGRMSFQQLGELGRRRPPQIPVLLCHLGEGALTTEPVSQVPEQRPHLRVVDLRVRLTGRERATFEHHHRRLGKPERPSLPASSLTNGVPATRCGSRNR